MTTARASASDASDREKLDAAIDAVEAGEIEVTNLKALHAADKEQIERLTSQRDDAFQRASEKPGPLIPTPVIIGLSFAAGAIAGAYVIVKVSH
jgi:hypothetical protein